MCSERPWSCEGQRVVASGPASEEVPFYLDWQMGGAADGGVWVQPVGPASARVS